MPSRRRNRTEIRRVERANADKLGDDYKFTHDQAEAQRRRERRKQRAQTELEAYHAFHRDKWTNCVVPGCEFTVPRLLDFTKGISIALCTPHQVAVWEHVNDMLDDPDVSETMAALKARREAILLAQADAAQAQAELLRQQRAERQRDLDAPGDIYYARVGTLIKVGWTGDLYERIRSYGADAELLAHYKGTRRDETNLHRNLAPSRAKGREWYRDDAVIRAFISNVIREHGKPRFTETQWTKPKQIVAGKRAMRTA
jgi:hypothetical protein